MSCHGISSYSDFGAPTSDDPAIIKAAQGNLATALRSPKLRNGDCFCLRTRPLCNQQADVQFLVVRRYKSCRPELLKVYIKKADGIDRCNPGSSISKEDQEYHLWDNSRGVFVVKGDCEDIDDTDTAPALRPKSLLDDRRDRSLSGACERRLRRCVLRQRHLARRRAALHRLQLGRGLLLRR